MPMAKSKKPPKGGFFRHLCSRKADREQQRQRPLRGAADRLARHQAAKLASANFQFTSLSKKVSTNLGRALR